MSKRTYVDSNLIIAAYKAEGELGLRALEILDDPQRQIVVSRAVWLEVLLKAIYHHQRLEQAFCLDIFENAEVLEWDLNALQRAEALAQRHGIAAMDAIHVALAITAGVDEMVTAEKPQKPMFRVNDILISSIWV